MDEQEREPGAESGEAEPAEQAVPVEPETAPALEREERPSEAAPPAGVRPSRIYLMSALISAVTALVAAGLFLAGFATHALIEDDEGEGQTVVARQTPTPVGQAAEPTPTGPIDVSPDDDPAFGPEDAAVTVVEFSDFQCPYCSSFAIQTLPQIKQTYGDSVRFVYRDFPLTGIHPNALKAAEAAECADDQGKFWEYHDQLFENQQALDDESLKQYAATVGLDAADFASCLDSEKYRDEVEADLSAGESYGVTGTPTLFINGQKVVGAQPFATFQQVIDAELAKAGE